MEIQIFVFIPKDASIFLFLLQETTYKKPFIDKWKGKMLRYKPSKVKKKEKKQKKKRSATRNNTIITNKKEH